MKSQYPRHRRATASFNVAHLMRPGHNHLAVVLGMTLLSAASFAQAATLTVTNTNDAGAGSLRQAISDALPGDTINFGIGGTIGLSTELVLDKDLTIQGPGHALLAVSGGNVTRVFNIGSAVVVIDGLTITGGIKPGAYGGGVYNAGTVTFSNSLLTGNSAPQGAGGAIVNAHGTVRLVNSTISGNSASAGAGIYNDDGNGSGGALLVVGSTISGNASDFGGAIVNTIGTATLINSTVSNNTGQSSGGMLNNGGQMTITNSTVSGNAATSQYGNGLGGGILNFGSLRLNNSIVAGNSAADSGPDIFSIYPITSNGHNFIGTTADIDGSAALTDRTFANTGTVASQLLAPLADNGGPTQTMNLPDGSLAVDAGENSISAQLTSDQRGNGYLRIVNGTVDMGAVELQGTSTPSDLIGDLSDYVNALVGVSGGIKSSLQSKLAAALAALAVPDAAKACSALQDYINAANAQRGKKLTLAQADLMIAQARDIMLLIGCP